MDPDPADDAHELDDDELADEMSEESFPGSDPPSTWSGAGTRDGSRSRATDPDEPAT